MTEKDLFPSSTHPPLPPTSEVEQFSRLRLLRSRRVGISTFKRLLAEYGTAQNALAALPQVARAAGVQSYAPCPPAVVQAELNAAARAGARLILEGSEIYPPLLAKLEDAPPFLWAIGQADLLMRPMIAMVGARNASSLGVRMARALARDLGAAGFVIVSGLARGIDAAAHDAALTSGTIAVQAGGVDTIYPPENAALAERIGDQGLRLSEQPMGLSPMARHFPARNRIISGLCQATIVIEAAGKSGSLITARDALDQGREVLAVPGHPFDARAAGCNQLIREGAPLIRSAEDVMEILGAPSATGAPKDGGARACPPAAASPPVRTTPTAPPPARQRRWSGATLQNQILERLGVTPIAEDQLIRDLAISAAEIAPALIDLEMDGHIERQAGGMLSKAE